MTCDFSMGYLCDVLSGELLDISEKFFTDSGYLKGALKTRCKSELCDTGDLMYIRSVELKPLPNYDAELKQAIRSISIAKLIDSPLFRQDNITLLSLVLYIPDGRIGGSGSAHSDVREMDALPFRQAGFELIRPWYMFKETLPY